MKTRFILITIIGLFLLMLPLMAVAEIVDSGTCGENLTWTLDDKGLLTINGTGEMNSSFFANDNIVEVYIENGVTSINQSAFSDCRNLKKITIPDTISNIGGAAFNSCFALTSINIPDGITCINANTFSGSGLTSISIPKSVVSIGNGAFAGCVNIKNITIPNGVTFIDNFAFAQCSSLKNIILPDTITHLGIQSFYQCYNLTNITIPNSVTCIDNYAFYDCVNLQKVYFCAGEDTEIHFGTNLFEGINIPTIYCYMYTAPDSWCEQNGITPIYIDDIDINSIRTVAMTDRLRLACGDNGFLEIETFPQLAEPIIWSSSDETIATVDNGTVTAIREGSVTITSTIGTVFATATVDIYIPVTSFTLSTEEIWTIAKEDVKLNIAHYEPIEATPEFTWTSSDESIALVDNSGLVTTIKPGEVIITATTEHGISKSALIHLCYPVTIIEFEQPVYYCKLISDIQLQANITMRTQNCVNHLVTFTSSDESIATVDETGSVHGLSHGTVIITATAASGVSATTEVQVHEIVIDPAVAPTQTQTGLTEGSHCSVCGEILVAQEVIPVDPESPIVDSGTCGDNLTWTLDYKGLLSITGTGDMYDYTDETTVLPKENIKEVIIYPGVQSIGNWFFFDCTNLTNISLPSTLSRIGDYAFYQCSNLRNFIIPDAVNYLGIGTFYGCSSLTSMSIPDGVQSLMWTFYGCSNLRHVSIPDSVTSIMNCTFRDCYNLVNVTFSSNITSILPYAFDNCGIQRIVFLHTLDDIITFDDPHIPISATIYCYEYSSVESWFNEKNFTVVLLDEFNIEEIRTISLPDGFSICCGNTEKINYNVFPDYDEPTIEWISSDPSIISIEDGTITAHSIGAVEITATLGTVSNSITVVSYYPVEAFDIIPSEEWIVAKESIQLLLTNIEPIFAEPYIYWTSLDTSLAVADANGLVTTKKPGDVTVCADSKNGIHRECLLHICYPVTAIELESDSDEMIPDTNMQLTAHVTMRTQSCENHLVTFSSSNPEIATVDENGLIHAISHGSATIIVESASGITASKTITVLDVCEVENGEIIDHLWGDAEYIWNEDNTTITAARVCQRHEEHIQTETVAVSSQETKPATCTEIGETTYVSDEFENEAFEVQSKTVPDIVALGHTLTAHAKVDSTCTATGTEAYWSCDVCGDLFSDAEAKNKIDEPVVIAAKGHKWNTAEYKWAEDNSTVTATRTCKNDASHIETETVAVTAEMTSPTDTTEGSVTYITAEFSNAGFTVQTKEVKIPALSSMSVIHLPSMLTMIEDEAFENLTCEAIIIPNSCTSIGNYAFRNCKNLKYIKVPAGIDIPSNAFEGCENVVIDRTAE